MERRSFLKGIIGAPAAIAVTKLDPVIAKEPEPWVPKVYDIGRWGILNIHFHSKMSGNEVTVSTRHPASDWGLQRETEEYSEYGPFRIFPIQALGRETVIVIPVCKLSKVNIFLNNNFLPLAAHNRPKWCSKREKYDPWHFYI